MTAEPASGTGRSDSSDNGSGGGGVSYANCAAARAAGAAPVRRGDPGYGSRRCHVG
ncbi:excalibur calcium-binding domain-containing protein [Streptomyces sp. NWU49]|uniref:excalibur calcium-binding domain-containing protein n=1 Tax=Streptomyces sp. NWU49 TaxID=2201153 RepID=UPI00215AB8E1|nr:excalibur calcium-binding domain-containing protein [Streptomyces sp. NWU49]